MFSRLKSIALSIFAGDWDYAVERSEVIADDGTTIPAGTWLKRRWNNGWQYRALTPEEQNEAQSWWATK